MTFREPERVIIPDYGPPPRRSRLRWLGITVALASLCAFGGALWYAYSLVTRGRGADLVPLVEAEAGPVKKKPTDPGGMPVPNQSMLVYNRAKVEKAPEHLLPPPEAPLPKPAPAPAPEARAPAPSEPTASPAPAATVETMKPLPAEPPPEAKPSTPPAPPPGKQVAQATPKPSTPPPATIPVVATPGPAAGGGGFRLQLSALRTDQAAMQDWARLKGAHGDVLGKLAPQVSRADLGEKGVYYRLQAGSFPDRGAAEQACQQLRARNVGCIVVRS